VRWNRTALIWLAAFWLPVVGAYAHLLSQTDGRLAADAALVYAGALAAGLALVTAACVAAHALLVVGVRWLLAPPAEAWRRPAAAALCVAVGWPLAYEWTIWAMRLAGAFVAPQPLPDALARAIGLGIALAYLLLGLAVAGAPLLAALLPALLPASPARPAGSAPRLIAPRPYPLTRAMAAARAPAATASVGSSGGRPAAVPAPATGVGGAAPRPPASLPIAPPPALDTPLLLRYPARPTVTAPAPSAPVAAEPPPVPRVTMPIAPEPRVVPVVRPAAAPVPRTVPVLPAAPQATAPPDDSVRIATDVYLEIVVDDHLPT
jgi:hypothetical protein